MAEQGDNDGLPNDFDPNAVILLKGSTLNAILRAIKANRIRIEDGKGLLIKERSPTGTVLTLDTDTCPS